jgi:hypothetical protein
LYTASVKALSCWIWWRDIWRLGLKLRRNCNVSGTQEKQRRFFGVQKQEYVFCNIIKSDETCYGHSTTVWLSKCSLYFHFHVKIYLRYIKLTKCTSIIFLVLFYYLFIFCYLKHSLYKLNYGAKWIQFKLFNLCWL